MRHDPRTRARLWFAAVLVLLAGVAGCDKPAKPPTPVERNQINVQPQEKLQDGGTLNWPLARMPANYNVYQADGGGRESADVVEALLPSAFLFDAGGKPYPNMNLLAEEPRLTFSPKQVVTYRIHPKAVWSDGTPITWTDFHWQWMATNGTNPAYRIGSAGGYQQIESVAKGADEREVVVTFQHRYADWTSVFNPIYPAATNRDPKVFNDGWRDRPLASAGPFRLDRVDAATHTIALVRDERWWGRRAKLDSIVFRAVDPGVQLDALAKGAVDFAVFDADPDRYRRAKKAEVDVRVAAGPTFRQLTLNSASPLLRDVRVRRALAMAIDRAAIAEAMLGPLDLRAKPLGNHLLMANQDGYQDNSGDLGRYAPEQAKRLLDEAGWALSGTVRAKDGKALELTFVVPDGVRASKQEAELVAGMLAQLGVVVKISPVPAKEFFDGYLATGRFDLATFTWHNTPYPISASRPIYASPAANATGTRLVSQNYARAGAADIDALFDRAAVETDRAKLLELANDIDVRLWEEVHSLPLYQRPTVVACRKGLANFGAFGLASTIYADIGWERG